MRGLVGETYTPGGPDMAVEIGRYCPHPSHALAAAVVDAAVAMEVAFGEWRNAYMAKDAPHDTDEYLRVSDAATEAKHDFADAVRALLASLDRELGA